MASKTSQGISEGQDWRSRALISIAEGSAVLGISRAGLYRLIAAGRLKVVRLGGRVGIRPQAIDELLEASEGR